MRRNRRLAGVLTALLVLVGALAPPLAAADGSFACSATVAGQQAGTGTITVQKDDAVSISGEAKPFSTTSIFLSFVGIRKKIGEATAGADGVWQKTVNVKSYAKWGVGLYRVNWKSIPAAAAGKVSKEATCSADVKVEGSFFGSRVSWVGSAMLAMGAAGMLLTLKSTLSIYRGRNAKWELKASAKAKVERDEETGKVRVKIGYSFAQTLLSTVWGLLSGGAGFIAMVGTATTTPTITLALSVTMPLTLAGFLLGQAKLSALQQAAVRQTGLRRAAATIPAPA